MIPPRHWQDPVIAAVGACMLVSPWITGYALVQPAVANAVITGMLLFTVGLGAAVIGRPWVECACILLGAWMTASPWALAFSDAPATRTAVATGALTLVLGTGALASEWRSARAPRNRSRSDGRA